MEGVNQSVKKIDIVKSLFSVLKKEGATETDEMGFLNVFQLLVEGEDKQKVSKGKEGKSEWDILMQQLLQQMQGMEKTGDISSEDWINQLKEIVEKIKADFENMKTSKQVEGKKEDWMNRFLEKEEPQIKKIEHILIEHSSSWTEKFMISPFEIATEKQITITDESAKQIQTNGNSQENMMKQEKEVLQLWKGLIDLTKVGKQAEHLSGDMQDNVSGLEKKEKIKADTNALFLSKTESGQNQTSSVENQIKNLLQNKVLQPMSTFQMIRPEKIILQLKPMDLGKVEITIEKINGEIHIKMKSDNDDVQKMLDGMADEVKDEIKMRNETEGTDAHENDKQEEKTKEERVPMKNEDEEKEKNDSSFETQWLNM